MKNLKFKDNYISIKSIVSRKNQDGTSIIMKLDDSNIFYKINSLASLVWGMLQTSINFETINSYLNKHFANVSPEVIENDLNSFFEKLTEHNLVTTTLDPVNVELANEISKELSKFTEYSFEKIQEFDLEQIEKEVLNESIYLDVFAGSDLNLKSDIESLKNSLHKINQLDGISFQWNSKANAFGAEDQSSQIGLIAQQVATVFPELTRRDANTGILAVNYTKLTPYLVESIKELKKLVENQSEDIQRLHSEIKSLKNNG